MLETHAESSVEQRETRGVRAAPEDLSARKAGISHDLYAFPFDGFRCSCTCRRHIRGQVWGKLVDGQMHARSVLDLTGDRFSFHQHLCTPIDHVHVQASLRSGIKTTHVTSPQSPCGGLYLRYIEPQPTYIHTHSYTRGRTTRPGRAPRVYRL